MSGQNILVLGVTHNTTATFEKKDWMINPRVYTISNAIGNDEIVEKFDNPKEGKTYPPLQFDSLFLEKIAENLFDSYECEDVEDNAPIVMEISAFPNVIAWIDPRYTKEDFIENIFGSEEKDKMMGVIKTTKITPIFQIDSQKLTYAFTQVNKKIPGLYRAYAL